MSWRLAVWEGTRPANDADARHTFEALQARWLGPDHAAPSPAITGFLSAVIARWSDQLEEDSEDSPWSDAPLGEGASGPIASLGFTHGFAQVAAPAAAGLATERGLVCFDPQTESLWDNERCLDAIVEVEGERTTIPALSPDQLDWFAEAATDALAQSGFEPWPATAFGPRRPATDHVGTAWRIALAGAGGAIQVRWALLGQHAGDPNVSVSLRVRNELIERLLDECRGVTRTWSPGPQWTFVTPLHRAIRTRLRTSVTDAGELEDLVAQLDAAGHAAHAVVARCATVESVLELGELDYQRHTIARVLQGESREAVQDMEGLIHRLVPQGRWRVVADAVRFLEWMETTLPRLILAIGPPRRLAVRWEETPRSPPEPPWLTDAQRRRFGISSR